MDKNEILYGVYARMKTDVISTKILLGKSSVLNTKKWEISFLMQKLDADEVFVGYISPVRRIKRIIVIILWFFRIWNFIVWTIRLDIADYSTNLNV